LFNLHVYFVSSATNCLRCCCYNSGVDVAAALCVCCKDEHCAVIRLWWCEGVPGPQIHRRLSTQYGNRALPKYGAYKWIDNFKSGTTSVMTGDCTFSTDENTEQVCAKILNHRRVTVDEVAKHLQLSCGCTPEIIQLGLHKLCARCIPMYSQTTHRRVQVHMLGYLPIP